MIIAADKTIKISIHAPARGATISVDFPALLRPISIHAPARGATLLSFAIPALAENFNPRSREGSDKDLRRRLTTSNYFNPRSREGSDRKNTQ